MSDVNVIMYHPSNTLMTFAADIGEDRQIELQKMVDKFIKSDETCEIFFIFVSEAGWVFKTAFITLAIARVLQSGTRLFSRKQLCPQDSLLDSF